MLGDRVGGRCEALRSHEGFDQNYGPLLAP